MKLKITIIVLWGLISSLCNAQTVYLYTPNGSVVYALATAELSSADIAYINNACATTYPNAEILATASSRYNCHSYAWNLTELGSIVCWLNQHPSLHLYWDDGSYEQTTEANAMKIFYYEGDHSAVKSVTHNGKYESKRGSYPLVRHSPDYGPYTNMHNRRYYRRVCPVSVDFINRTVRTYTSVTSCGNINVQNVEIMSTNKLILNATTSVTIDAPFEVQPGAELEINILQ